VTLFSTPQFGFLDSSLLRAMTLPAIEPPESSPLAWRPIMALGLLAVVCLALAGWPGAVLAAVAGMLVTRTAPPERGLLLLAGGVFWLAISQATGNRTLFFPFTCWLAAAVFLHGSTTAYWRAVVLSALVMLLFFLIRIQQGASGSVLWMELVASITLAGLTVVAEGLFPQILFRNWLVSILISLLAGLSVIL